MKSILSYSIVLLFVAALAGCETDPSSSGSGPEIRPMHTNTQEVVDPAITFSCRVTRANKTHAEVCVLDADGTDLNFVYKSANSSANIYYQTWSPSGGSIAFVETDVNVATKIKTQDLSVASNGRIVVGTTRTIYTAGQGVQINGASWSSLTATAKVAFSTLEGTNTNKIQLVSSSGGTATVLYQITGSNTFGNVTWSPDDEKIAFVESSTSGPDTLRVIDASNGTLLESVELGTTSSTVDIEWSRSGADIIAVTINKGSGLLLYYVTPTTGSTLWSNNVAGWSPTWAPDNSQVVTSRTGGLQKVVYNSTSASTFFTWGNGDNDWKQ